MAVHVRIPTPLRKLTHDVELVQVSSGTIAGAIAELQNQFPGIAERLIDEKGEVRRFVNIYLNEEDIRFLDNQTTVIKDGDEISIIPAIAGVDSFGCPNLSNGTMPTKISKPSKAITPPKGAPKASKASKAVKPLRKSLDSDKTAARFWLTYPPQRIKAPVIWKLGHQFKLVTSIRQASVTDVVGIVCLKSKGLPRRSPPGCNGSRSKVCGSNR